MYMYVFFAMVWNVPFLFFSDGSEVIASLEVENKRLGDRNQALQNQVQFDHSFGSLYIVSVYTVCTYQPASGSCV